MAVAIIMDFPGATLDQYDEVMRKMGLDSDDAAAPPHAISHWVAATDDGIRVVDVWETREAYEEFARTQIGPLTQEAGIPAPPATTFYEVHNQLVAR